MSKESRELKVVRHFSNKPVVSLPFKGRWLEEAGFKVGIQVNVIVRNGCLVILAPSAIEGKMSGGFKLQNQLRRFPSRAQAFESPFQ